MVAFWPAILAIEPWAGRVLGVLKVMVITPLALLSVARGVAVSAVAPTKALPGPENERYTRTPATSWPPESLSVRVTVLEAPAAKVAVGAIGSGLNAYESGA